MAKRYDRTLQLTYGVFFAMKWLWFAYKNLIRNRRRSLMTIIITAVSTASVLISIGFALYNYDSLREMSTRESGHIVIAHPDYFDKEEEIPMEYGLSNYDKLKQKIEPDERVKMTIPRLQFSGLISNGDKSVIFSGTGVNPDGGIMILFIYL